MAINWVYMVLNSLYLATEDMGRILSITINYHTFSHHVVDKALNGIVITDVNLVQVDGEVDVVPHAVVVLHMVIKSLYGGNKI